MVVTKGRIVATVVTLRDDPRARDSIAALRAQTGVTMRLMVIDNEATSTATDLGPLGGAVSTLDRHRYLQNLGLSGALESVVQTCTEDYLLNVNPDCLLDAHAVASAAEVLDRDPAIGAIAFHLRRPDGSLDSAGIALSPWTLRAFDRGTGCRADQWATDDDVDAPCLAGALLRVSSLRVAADASGEIFDTRFMAYQEDVDLGWRLRRAGFRIRHVVRASGVHARGFQGSQRSSVPPHVRRWSLRNRWWALLKNAPWWSLLLRSPMILLQEGAIVGYLLVKEPRTLGAYSEVLSSLPSTFRRRRFYRTP